MLTTLVANSDFLAWQREQMICVREETRKTKLLKKTKKKQRSHICSPVS